MLLLFVLIFIYLNAIFDLMKGNKRGRYDVENTVNLDNFPHIKGYDFNGKFGFPEFMKSYSTMGFQGSSLSKAIEIFKIMKREKASIFLAFTSNMISSGNRDIIRYLVEKKYVDALVTTVGGIEEDVIKSIKPFVLGSFDADGKYLFDKGVNKTGNIFVTNDRYTELEKFMNPIIEEAYRKQLKDGKALCANEFIDILGSKIESRDSYLYWAHRNKIPVYCPAPTDGSLGDLLFFQRQRHSDFQLDVLGDIYRLVKLSMNAEKAGVIILGGGVVKHFLLNAQIFRDGADYAIYVNSMQEMDGSDSGAGTDEAVTWGKIKANAPQVKVHGDATIIFPLIVAGALKA